MMMQFVLKAFFPSGIDELGPEEQRQKEDASELLPQVYE